MASRNDDQPYKVVYSTRTRERDPVEEPVSRQRSRREYDYPVEKTYSRDYRDDRSEVDRRSRASDQTYSESHSLPSAGGTTKIKYEVGKGRNSNVYVKRNNAVVIERPRDSGRSEYEVVRPERTDDGSYVVDIGGGRARARSYVDRDLEGYDTTSRARYSETQPAASRSSRGDDIAMYDAPRDRAVNQFKYKDVEIVEDPYDDPRYRRGPTPEAPIDDVAPLKRRKSALRGRNDTPPSSLERRRSQSVGFYRDQVSHHDASEERHERPGAEARIAGRYLRRQRDYDDDDDDDHMTDTRGPRRSRPRDDNYPQRNDLRLNDYEYDNDRRTYTEETMRRYEYEDDQRPANPTSRRYAETSRRDQRGVDDRAAYSGYESRSRREYYR